jgi:HlyD family secretion protein
MSLQPSPTATSPEHPAPNTAHTPVATGSPNGSAPANKPSRLPRGRQGSQKWRILIPALVLIVLLVVGGSVYALVRKPAIRTDLTLVPVEYRDLQLKVVERGTLEAKDNHYIVCDVKSGSRGLPKIKWVLDNGSLVHGPTGDSVVAAVGVGGYSFRKPGELLVDIDDSYLQEQATNQKILRDQAETAKITAELNYPNLQINIQVAKEQLKQWVEGNFPQQANALKGNIQNAEAILLQQEDRTAWVSRMVKKGYMNASQEESEQANLTGDKLSLDQYKQQLDVLNKYTDPVNRLQFQTAITKAENDERTGYTTMLNNRAVFFQQEAQYQDLLQQLKQSKVHASRDGIVVYYMPEQASRGFGSNQSIIAQGENVAYGQKMMGIPDLSHMNVKVRVHEAFINHLYPGLKVMVRVDAVPGRSFQAHVKSVANAAVPLDFMAPDVKVYETLVAIDDDVQEYKLKPGLSAAVTILTNVKADHVLSVPITALVNSLDRTGKPRVFVMGPNGPEAREVEMGMSDRDFVEIKSGLNEGEKVVTSNPRSLLSEEEKKAMQESERNSTGGPGGKGGGSGKGKAGGLGGGPAGPGGGPGGPGGGPGAGYGPSTK